MIIFLKFLKSNKAMFVFVATMCSVLFTPYISAIELNVLPEHRVIFDVQPHQGDYRLTLSTLKKVNSELVASREKKVSGLVSRKTLEFTGNLTPDEAWRQLTSIFSSSNKQVLFECAGLDCGSSNAWANSRFEIKQLYGLDVTQFYRVLENVKNGQVSYDVLYLVQRGNRRIYAQLDKIIIAESNSEILLTSDSVVSTLKNKGFIVIPASFKNNNFVYSPEVVQLFVQVLNMHPEWRVALVGHSSKEPLDQKNSVDITSVSTLYAQYFLSRLEQELNYKKKLVHVVGVGPLAPRDFFAEERVELVLLK